MNKERVNEEMAKIGAAITDGKKDEALASLSVLGGLINAEEAKPEATNITLPTVTPTPSEPDREDVAFKRSRETRDSARNYMRRSTPRRDGGAPSNPEIPSVEPLSYDTLLKPR